MCASVSAGPLFKQNEPMDAWQRFGLVFLGSGLGGVARYAVQTWALERRPDYPFGTLAVNIIGGLLIGLYASYAARHGWGEEWRLLLPVGLLGGFTTFSAFTAESARMWSDGRIDRALGYVLVSVVAAFLACAAGSWLGSR